MKKIIGSVEYNTEQSARLYQYVEGAFGDPRGFEESLYQTPDGKLFLYVNGGPDSPYPQENIKRISKAKADEWRTLRK